MSVHREDYGRRFTVERSFAWLGHYRRLLIRWERHFIVYRAFFVLALARICLNRLI
jgi:transposase